MINTTTEPDGTQEWTPVYPDMEPQYGCQLMQRWVNRRGQHGYWRRQWMCLTCGEYVHWDDLQDPDRREDRLAKHQKDRHS